MGEPYSGRTSVVLFKDTQPHFMVSVFSVQTSVQATVDLPNSSWDGNMNVASQYRHHFENQPFIASSNRSISFKLTIKKTDNVETLLSIPPRMNAPF